MAFGDYTGHYAYSSLHPVKAFIDRPALHHRIRQQLDPGSNQDGRDGTSMLAVWGLGGAGKTQLVLDYLHRHRPDYKATFWIEAGRKELIERDFVCIYQLLFGLRTTAGQEVIKADEAVAGVKSWLSSRTSDRCLLVIDGADTVDDEEDDEYIDLMHYVPESRLLDVIVTTRSATAKDMTALDGVEVGEMEEEQAVDLFYALSTLKDRGQPTNDEITLIVEELGLFALAVTLAGTYVAQTPRLLDDIKQYLPEYRERRRKLLSQKPKRLVHQYGESVLTTWEASFKAVQRQCAEACRLLTLLAFLGFDDIFLELFDPKTLNQDSSSGSWKPLISSDVSLDKYKIEECFRVLQTYSLVQRKENQASYSMHKLVHAWGYERLESDQQREYSIAGLQLVQEAMTGCGKGPQAKLRLVSHIMANFSIIAKQGWPEDGAKTVLNQLGWSAGFVSTLGRWVEAYAIKEYICRKWRDLLGDEHFDTITAINDLAITLRDQGQLEKAVAMQEEVLEKTKRILGDEHPGTIAAMSNLATTLGDQGQLEKAAAIHEEVVEKTKRILGDEHPDTIAAMSNLAHTLRDQGQLEKAAAMQEEVLEKRKRILGDEHPDTIAAMSNLAHTLRDQGQLEKAAAMQEEVVEKTKRILGDEHPATIIVMNNLASMLKGQGQLEKAAAMQEEVVEKRKRILGDEHPDTITAMNNLASMLKGQGQLEKASAMQEEVVEKSRRILGDEHPATIIVMNNLASILRDQGQLEKAAAMQEEVVKKRKRILGDEHPDTITAMNNLASMLKGQGQLEKAAAMQEEVVEKSKRILGDEHPDTIAGMNNLASMLKGQGQLEKAAAMQEEVVEKSKRILGDEHPDTIVVMNNLASMLRDQGQLEKAAAIHEEVVEKTKRILGDKHPTTIAAINNLAVTLSDQGQLEKAAAMQEEVVKKRKQILGDEHPATIAAMNNLANTLGDQGQL
jgi:tetratricopeptide (TPR) repeat protein